MASWAYYDLLGADTIADLLNADLAKFPPPTPPGKTRARGSWSSSSVSDILRNPKYTGYQVYNRRATRSRHGKVNDPVKWVWSREPAHEPPIPKWMYDELTARRGARRRSRISAEPNRHPQTHRTYAFRAMVFCPCGRRMVGEYRHDRAYYLCRPRNNNRGRVPNDAPSSKRSWRPSTTTRLGRTLRGRYNELEAQRAELAAKLSTANEPTSTAPEVPTAEELSLLDSLPYLAVNLVQAPADLLRALFEVVQLHIQVHEEGNRATLTITLPADQIPQVTGAAERIGNQMDPQDTPGADARERLWGSMSCPR